MSSTSIDCTVKIGSKEITGDEVHDVLVEADLDQPDHAVVTLSNLSTKYSETVTEGDDVEVKLGFVDGKAQGSVFKGEVTGIEPIYDSRAPARVLIRGLNQLHRLTRGKKSVAFKQVTDKDIVDKLCQAYGLTAKYGDSPPSTKYEHVYQNNLTDLEFLRMRGSRIGCEVFVVDKELHFRKRDESDSGINLQFGVPGESALERFLPRLSTANQVSEVRVLGWDPDKKQEIVGVAKPQSSKLGNKTGADVAGSKHKNVLHIHVESPVSSKEDADNLAKALLNERGMHFITGDGVCRGNPDLKPGIIVTVTLNDKRFDGKYYITAVRHRYVHAGTSGGYRTEFKVRRDAKSESS
jgi:Bacteriophage probable baseplate hub protein